MVKNYGEINAVEDNSIISNESQYLTYNVHKNGRYIFKATNENGKTTETAVEVKNIEKFELIDNLELTYVNNEQKAYNYKGAAVPKGYYVDTNTKVNTGLVITDSIDSEGYSIGNEWVWVPVNSTIGNNDYYITEAGSLAGATTVTYSKYSKLYSFSSAKTRDPYGTFYLYGNTNEVLGKPSEINGSREPAILTYTTGEIDNYNQINQRGTKTKFTNVTGVANQYITDYNNMITSVDRYKGFYIGRYELSGNESQGIEKSGTSLTNLSWYQLYNACMTFDNNNMTSGMMYGSLWDATCVWLAKSGYDVGYSNGTISSRGNYAREEIKVSNGNNTIIVKEKNVVKKLMTGQTSYTRLNNIYDLGGNCYDFTQEAHNDSRRIVRGGYYLNGGWKDYTYISFRAAATQLNIDDIFSSRPYFCIK